MEKTAFLVFLVNTLFTAVGGLLHISLPLYVAENLGVSQGAITSGFILSFSSLVSLVSQIAWGYLSDVFRDRLRIALTGSILTLIFFAIALIYQQNFEIIKAIYILSPVGGSAVGVALYAYTADIGIHSLSKTMGFFWAGTSLGWALTVAITGFLLEYLGIAGIYTIALSLALIGTILIVMISVKSKLNLSYNREARFSLEIFVKLFRNKYFVVLFIYSFLFLVGDIVKNIFVVQYMSYQLGLGETLSTAILALASFSEVPMYLIAIKSLRRLGSSQTLYLSMLSMSIYLYLYALVRKIPEVVTLMIFYSIPWTTYALSISVLIPLTVDEETRGTALSLINANYTLVGATLSIPLGYITSTLGYQKMFIIVATTIILISIILSPVIYPLKNRYT
ncbi:MAG: MFS transporter [Desulfurococcaceae archaeon]|nr:MFS transporter [Desulfurococcaceae archaeon]